MSERVIIELEDYFLTNLQVRHHFPQKDEVAVERLSLNFDYDVKKHAENQSRRWMNLKVSGRELDANGNKVGVEFETAINGIFLLPSEWDEERQEIMLRINGVSILYSTLRGIIGNLSGSLPGGRFCLPTILPQEIVQQVEDGRQISRPVKKVAKKRSARKAATKSAKQTKNKS